MRFTLTSALLLAATQASSLEVDQYPPAANNDHVQSAYANDTPEYVDRPQVN